MRGVTTFAHRPVDPRSRRVVAAQRDSHTTVLQLECGHSIFRRHLCSPERVICDRCPPAGGLGGNRFAIPQSSHGLGGTR